MKTTRTRQWFRSVALGCAMAAGTTAFGDYYKEWSAEGKAYWDGESSWTASNEGTVLDDYRVTQAAAQIAFDKAVTDNAANFYVYGGSATLSADESSFGLTKDNWFCVGVWFGGSAAATIESGTYSFAEVNVGRWASGTLTLAGGSVTTPNIYVGTDEVTGTVTIDDGATVSAGQIAGGSKGSLEVNGGTFANATDATISVAVTGSGTLTKTGAGALAITGDVSEFTGSITVAEGAGSVTVGEGEGAIVIAAGETKSFAPDTTYYWSGKGEDNLWSNVNNWLVGNAVPTAPPAADSVVAIPEGEGELTIKVSGSSDHTGFLTINRDVRFERAVNNSNSWGISISKVEGSGTLTLAGNKRSTPLVYDYFHIYAGAATDGELVIDTDLKVTGPITLENQTPLRVNKSFSGDATLGCYSSNGQQGIHFHGDTTGFTGSYTGGTRASGSRDGTKFYGSALGGENASWKFGVDNSTNSGYSPFKAGDGVTYKFGQLTTIFDGYSRLTFETYHKSSNSDYASNVTLEVGGKANSVSEVGGAIDGTNNKIRKVGDTSTLNLTLTQNKGAVEAQSGTTVLNGTVAPSTLTFTGTGATVKIANTVGTYEEVVVTEDDPETTEVNEEVKDTQFTPYAGPGLSAELANCQLSVDTTTEEGYTIYTLVKVATAGETQYYTVADAIAALAEAEDKTVTLIANTTEKVVLPLSYTLVMGEFTAGSVAGAPGVAVSYDEATKTYATADNSEATWVGGAEGNWFDTANWSTGRLPDTGTKVVFNKNVTVFLAENNSYDCGEFYIERNYTVTLAPVDYNEANWPRVVVHGDITSNGGCTLKLYRCGVDNEKGSTVNVRPTIEFYNTTGDSWLTGNFKLLASITGTGEIRIYDGTLDFASGSWLTANEGSVIDFRNYYPTFPGKSGAIADNTGVRGNGRVIVHNWPARNDSASAYLKAAFTNSENWTGTLELNGFGIGNTYYGAGIDAANYGNMNSTVCFNGTSGYLRASDGATTEVGNVKTIEIGANGLTLNGVYTRGYSHGYIIAADIVGSGAIHFGTKDTVSSVGQYFLTGSLEGFTGAIDFGALDSYRPAVIIKDADAEAPAVNDFGQIIVAEGSEVTVAGAWNAPGGFVVYGDVTVASTGSITGTNGLCGDGTVTYESLPATAPGCCAGIASTGTNRDVPAWTGTVVLPGRSGSGQVPLAGLGREGSTIVVNGDITGQDANSIYLSGGTAINAKVELKRLLKLTNGSTGDNYTFAEVTGTGDMFLSATGSAGSPTFTYTFTKLNDYTGTINAVKTSDTKYAALVIGTVNVSDFVVGEPVVKLAANANLTTDPADITFTVDGETTDFDLMKADDGNIYVIVAEVTVPGDEPTTKQFGSYEAAAAFAEANNLTSFTVLAGDGELDGWTYDSEAGTLTANENTVKVADLDEEFATIAAARAADGFLEGSVITLIRDSDEDVTLAANETLNLDVNGKSYVGSIGGAGTFVAVQDFTPAFAEGWTGTFVIGWHIDGGDSGTAFPAAKYGNENSTVRFDAGASNIFFTNAAKNGPECLTKLYLASDVSIKNGWGISGTNTRLTTFSEVTIEDGVTFSLRDNPGAQTYFAITKLVTEGGKIVVPAKNTLTISEIVTDTDSPYLALEKHANGTLNGLDFVTVNDQAKALCYRTVNEVSGLYDAVAKFGDTTYDTLAAACAAAEEHSYTTVTLLVARDTLNETIPDGWEYNTPEASGTDFGTLTKVVPSGDIEVDTDDCNFTVDATTAATIADATGVATTDPNFGKAAIAYVVGGELEDGEVVIPTPTITVADGKATVVYSGDDPHVGDYTVTCTLWSFALADANDSTKWTPVATGGIGANLVDTNATAASKFYKVTVTVTKSQLGNETDSGEGA